MAELQNQKYNLFVQRWSGIRLTNFKTENFAMAMSVIKSGLKLLQCAGSHMIIASLYHNLSISGKMVGN